MSACSAGDLGLIPGSGRSPGEGNGTQLQYSCPENLMDGEPGRLQSMGSLGVGHNWATSLSLSIETWKSQITVQRDIKELLGIIEMFYILTVLVLTKVHIFEWIYLANLGLFKSQPTSVYTSIFTCIHTPNHPKITYLTVANNFWLLHLFWLWSNITNSFED